ncbi:hypothetical protein [Pseudomonas sp. CNPSo 3701]|uniref:hypothetical protein n=1 Tax=Pseudomonas sp. CNPSo 3701 TaxID=3027943 RepID=UPI0023635624|nr:hypothetical protein [Pseudomonas sp. CNPSo 3701]MDD1509563.1 hypothetical protein [Pseudomonas sp. CNPSo 3701]
MESRIPVPTDNLFKFYALFGLLLFVFACGALIYVNQTTNTLMFESVVELERLKEQENPSPSVVAKISALERMMDVGRENKRFYVSSTGFLAGIGFWLAVYGFARWHRKLQPLIDESQRVQLEIAKLQLAKLQLEVDELKGKRVDTP